MDSQPELEPKTKRQRLTWNDSEDNLFLDCWEVSQCELRKCQRNSHIFARMAQDMGTKFSAEDIKTKVKNFTQKYRNEKKEIGPSGGSPSQWKHFSRVHKIIGSSATNSDTVDESFECEFLDSDVFDSDVSYIPDITFNEGVSPPLRVPIPLSSTSSTSTCDLLTQPSTSNKSNTIKKRKTARSDALESLKEHGEEHLSIFRQAVKDNKSISCEIVHFLKEQKETDAKMLSILEKLVDQN